MSKKNKFSMLEDEIDDDLEEMNEQADDQVKQFDHSLLQTSQAKEIRDLFSLPIDQLIPFQAKGDGDFSPWDEEEIDEMARQMDHDGSYEPILVRQISTKKYEILAGEHRVKASRKKGLSEVRAVVFRGCDDVKAKDIFLLTNLQRRKTKISDEIYGWNSFYENHPNIRSAKNTEEVFNISGMIEEGKAAISSTQLYRYVSMSHLIKPLIQALDDGKLTKRTGYELSRLPDSTQKLFIPYLGSIHSKQASELVKLNEKTPLTPEIIESYFSGKSAPAAEKKERAHYDSTLRKGMTNIRKTIKTKINPQYYDQIDDVINVAIAKYVEEHPEVKL